jgi:sarcosine oxidase delta subunit
MARVTRRTNKSEQGPLPEVFCPYCGSRAELVEAGGGAAIQKLTPWAPSHADLLADDWELYVKHPEGGES